MNPLVDREFIENLSLERQREIYVKVTALNFDEMPLEAIEGKITNSGTINIDGKSNLRRSCSLSFISDTTTFTNFYWGVGNKFKLEIGLRNNIEEKYPEIIWFNQGIYVTGSFSYNVTSNNISISIGGKDKMCLLNGDLGGSLPGKVDFGQIEEFKTEYTEVNFNNYYADYVANKYYVKNGNEYVISNDEYSKDKTYYEKNLLSDKEQITLETIIREAVHTYGKESYKNIIINDLDEKGLELLEYRGDKTLYLIYDEDEGTYIQMIVDPNFELTTNPTEGQGQKVKISELSSYNPAIEIGGKSDGRETFKIGPYTVSVTKVEYGHTIGYRLTDLVYPGELVSSAGEALTSMLDKIKNILGDFEYFYDVDGQFIFQKKKIYSQTSWSTLENNGYDTYARDSVENDEFIYSFKNNDLITSISNNSAINEIKNDYVVWGVRKSVSGAEVPIHARFAIQQKPLYYKNFDNEIFYSEDYEFSDGEEVGEQYDWRELIFQMQKDYYKHYLEEDFLYNVAKNNMRFGLSESWYPDGITGYEPFYIDLQGFWRELYDINPVKKYAAEGGYYELKQKPDSENPSYYRTEYEWQNYIIDQNDFICDFYLPSPDGVLENENYSVAKKYWNKQVFNSPETLNFWFDFYDSGDSLQEFSVSSIGLRSKVVNDNKITSIYFRSVPQIILINPNEPLDDRQKGYTYIQLTKGMLDLFTISSQGRDAKLEIDNLFNNYSITSESISLQSIPIYNLEPNTLIYVNNAENGINGKYEVDKITVPLTYNGTMSISARKIFN